ncbi:lysyl-tRNA synthetase, class II [Rubritalea squalenifaciens DSM 18772]|uniref:Lysine--tRNA ligase n=1 Tax=Rubritalea squalenifaciens DSM 18772 TaxID=1123071 RepID=A0A1M6I693_9BACT|nr:lysine--tRNA ligase [Rubritalea squalenifaciens]SHJ29941.1 lysyl-tRNA synthetase, class II [Rubritalea squalenifaciens DSM 18772]
MSEQTTQPQSTEAELIAVRREKLEKLRELGIDPFGSKYEVSTTPGELKENFENDKPVKIAGRLLAIRDMGKSVFATIGDVHGRIQIYLNQKGISESEWAAWKLMDMGDWIGIEGETFTTGKGEPSVKVVKLTVLSKALRPMPDKWHGVSDRETKYRKRHLDLMSNQASADLFVKRSLMIAEIRAFLSQRGFLEVETPMLHDVAGGAAARPFNTHHNALDMPLTLRIAPELHLKRLLCGGFTKIFELNRNFRNEGISRRHNPEFTMLEAYWAFSDFEQMADLVEEMTCHLAEKFCGSLQIEHKNEEGETTRTIDLSRPWKRASYHDLIKEAAGDDWFNLTPDERRAKCADLGVEISANMEDYEVTQQVFEKLIEEHTFNPCFVTHVAKELIPLAKLNPENPEVIDVYELIINGQEISPGYSELNDPILQRQRFEEQAGGEAQKVDHDFVETMESGMPPAGGIGIGIDRLIMMLTGAPTIRDVVLFPQLKRKD